MATNMTFVDYVTPIPADWLNFVNTYVNSAHTSITVVNSITALRGLLHSTNTQALVTGYYTASDGGGGIYSYISTDVTSPDNGGSIIVASDGGRWYLQNTGSVSVKQFGAISDNTTDNSAAFQNAINSGATRIHVPVGEYRINTTLNFTNRTTPLVIYGDGAYYENVGGTVVHFFTGTWMADMTGCQFLHLEHMRWLADGTTGSSTLGVLYARSTVVNFAILNSMFKMVIEVASNPSASLAGSIALADNCVENFLLDACWFEADSPYVSTLGNELHFASVYATLNNVTFSNTDKTFRQCLFTAHQSYAMNLTGVADSTWDQCNWTITGSLGAGVLAAMILQPSVQGYQKCANLRFTGDFESFPSIAYLTGNTQDIVIDCTTAGTTYSFVQPYTGTVHDGFKLKANQLSGTQTNLILSVGPGVTMNNAEIYMQSGQTILDGNLTITSGFVYGGINDLSNTGVLSINSASNFQSSYTNSKLTGSVAWQPNGGAGIPAGSTAVTTVTVPGAVGGMAVRVLVPYAIPFCIASGYVTTSNVVELLLSNVNASTSAAFGNGNWVVEVTKIHG